MDEKIQTQILAEVIRIGDELISQREKDNFGLHWKTQSIDLSKNILWTSSESIYSGVSGIIIFFIELYKYTHCEKYLNIIINSSKWLENYCNQNPTQNYSFLTGRMSVPFTFAKIYELTNDNDYLKKALKYSNNCDSFLKANNTLSEYINGISGTLVALLFLYSITNDESLLAKIDSTIESLIEKVQIGTKGIYWDKSFQQIRGLCGFSHGVAGIGAVLLELGNFFRNESFYYLAEQAFLYESYFYDKNFNNWPDFRKGIYSENELTTYNQEFEKNNIAFFTKGKDMNAWCHGAAGIGLSRARAFKLLNKNVYKSDVINAINKTIETDITKITLNPTFTLCHGKGGNADLFIEAYKLFNDEYYISLAEDIAFEAIQYKSGNGIYLSGYHNSNNKEDLSLFMGTAGIGYFYLKLLDPYSTPNILYPQINKKINSENDFSDYHTITIPLEKVREKIINKSFKKTFYSLNYFVPQIILKYLTNSKNLEKSLNNNTGITDEKTKFIDLVKDQIKKSQNIQKDFVKDIFTYELEKLKLNDSVKSYIMLYLNENLNANKTNELMQIANENFKNLILCLNENVTMINTNWELDKINTIASINGIINNKNSFYFLLKITTQGLIEEKLSDFTYRILIKFKRKKVVKDIISEIIDQYAISSIEEEEYISSLTIQQIKELISIGILVQ